MKRFTAILLICTGILLPAFQSVGQVEKGFPMEKYKRNIIKWNLTPFIIWDATNVNLAFERVLKPNQSFSADGGVFPLPISGIYDSLNIEHVKDESGFTVSGDYRFYITNCNPRQAPDGLYWGFYSSFHNYKLKNEISVIDNPDFEGSLLLDGKMNIFSAGVELGYQFIIKEKLSIDLVFIGPSLSVYAGTLKLDGKIESEEYGAYPETIKDIIINRLPFAEELIKEGDFNDNGLSARVGLGFQYLI